MVYWWSLEEMWDGPCLAPQVLELERKWVELSGRKSVAPSVGKWWGKTDGKLALQLANSLVLRGHDLLWTTWRVGYSLVPHW